MIAGSFRVIQWNGQFLKQQAREASVAAVDDTMRDAVTIAQAMTPVLTGRLKASEQILVPAHVVGNKVVGKWGSQLWYAIWVEVGSNGRSGVYMFRRAADYAYGDLKDKLGAHFKSRAGFRVRIVRGR